jgi:hypothetical protein
VKWLPHHRFEIVSPLDRQAALAAVTAHTEPENWFRFTWPNSANDKRFEGVVGADGFHVRRVIGYRNSFLPVIDGKVHAAGRGSRIDVSMRLFWFVYAFVGIWVVAALTGFAASGGAVGLAFGAAMILFVYVMTMAGFWFEAGKQERTLREIFQARSS